MKSPWIQLVSILWIATQIGAYAYDPTEVDGTVTVAVDRSEPVWKVTVTNHSEQELSYEMMDKVPRGLGLELWDDQDDGGVALIHAENLAKFLNIDGFPADIREIAPGKSAVFRLDRNSMSTTSDMALAKWERAKRIEYYACRVFFGVYASRMLSVSPKPREKKQGDEKPPEPPPAWLTDDVGDDSGKDALFGFKLRRMLNEKKLAIVDWNYGTNHKDVYEITYTSCAEEDLKRMAPWDENKPMELPLHELVAKAHVMARQKIKDCRFDEMMINKCEDDPSKHFASLYFSDDHDDVVIHLLLNGAATKTTTIPVTKEQLEELTEFRIPKIRDQDGAEQEPKPDQ